MPVFAVVNPKGGVGKSTLSTQIAGWCAQQGFRTMLGDIDRQQSSRAWLQIRPASVARIESWDLEDGRAAKPPKGVSHVVLDTPAGLHGKRLREVLQIAHRLIVPLQPSIFDILATRDFMAHLAESMAEVRGDRPFRQVGVVGMRVDARTRAADQLQRYVDGLGLPVLGWLRDTQNYVQLAAHGLTLFDVAPHRVQRDLDQWADLTRWLRDGTLPNAGGGSSPARPAHPPDAGSPGVGDAGQPASDGPAMSRQAASGMQPDHIWAGP